MINLKEGWLTLPGPVQAVPGSLEVEDDVLENDGIHSVLDDEGNSENNHDLEMMDEHGKNVTGHEFRVFAHEKFAVKRS